MANSLLFIIITTGYILDSDFLNLESYIRITEYSYISHFSKRALSESMWHTHFKYILNGSKTFIKVTFVIDSLH